MKFTRFLLAALAFAGAPALAAPTDVAPATAPLAPLMVPQIDARAVALLDQSVKAYAALDKLSQEFSVVNSKNGQVQSEDSFSGSFMFQKPGSARMEFRVDKQNVLIVTNGTTLISQTKPNQYEQQDVKRNSIKRVLGSMPSSADVPLSLLVAGRNPLTDESAPQWQSVRLDSKDGLSGVVLVEAAVAPHKPATLGVYLDPKTHLLARVEVSVERAGAMGQPTRTYSELTNFAPSGSTVTPGAFQYAPAPGVERHYSFDKNLIVGAKPFALNGKTLDGKSLSLDDYQGKVVLLNFWATWCGPCLGELPNVKANYDKYHSQGFDIVGISLDEEEAELREFVEKRELPWPQIFDGMFSEVGDAHTYGVEAIPFTLLIGKDGKIAAVNPRDEDLEPEIREALAK